MKKKKYVDTISAILLIALGLVYFYAAARLPEPLTPEPLGPAGFPQFLAVILIGLSAWILVRALLDKSEEANTPANFTPKDIKCFLLVIGLLVLYVVGMQILGYLLSTFLFASVCFCIMGASWKKPTAVLLPSVVIAAVCYVLFKVLFRADLPSGFLI
ncbi:tripartite tricarboxylate transporter TctB family protein [Anaerotruncus colihominis]|uniref:tripartite tricarboxylate transporter TctB family protein n=1 Tax=Anaerotruncus colihominis TaxID=169435 RepID=UPI003519B3F9